MGTSIEMIVLEKTNGVPFHQLSFKEQEAIGKFIHEQQDKGTYKEPEEVFSAGNHFELMDFFEKSLENLSKTMNSDGDDLYYYIDAQHVENVLKSTRDEIDRLYESADRYDPELYLPYSTLGRLAQFYHSVKKTAEEKGFENHYLIIDIG